MNDSQLELELREWFRANVPGSEVAPATLRVGVASIPRTITVPKLSTPRNRIGLLAAAALIALVAGIALLAGSAALNQLSPSPRPTVSALPRPSAAPRPAAWTAGQSLLEARSGDVIGISTWAVLLSDGRVLAAGGLHDTDMPTTEALASAELYDPASRTWTPTGAMARGRTGHTMTLLSDGRVLVAGGNSDYHSPTLASAELYDPRTGTWSETASMRNARAYHTATLLPDGRVLVAGGSRESQCRPQDCSQVDVVESVETYDPVSGQWAMADAMPAPRQNQAATSLADGMVLIEGGGRLIGLSSAQLFEPLTGTWRATGSMSAGRNQQAAALLPDGRVFVVGGQVRDHIADPLIAAEIFDPATSAWTPTTPSPSEIGFATATVLRSGDVLVVGGNDALLYDPSRDSWTLTSGAPRLAGEMTIALRDGTVLVMGGNDGGNTALGLTWIYDPGTTLDR